MKQTIKVGAKVQVVNQTSDGKDLVEGYAIVRGMDYREQNERVYCSVEFDNGDVVYRWISINVWDGAS